MKRIVLALILSASMLTSCTRESSDDRVETMEEMSQVEKMNLPCLVRGTVYEDRLRIKMEQGMADAIESANSASAPQLSGILPMDAVLDELGAVEFERIFSHGGKYEQRRREAGLHLWYTVVYDESIDLMTAANRLAEIDGIALIEGVPIVEVDDINTIVDNAPSGLQPSWAAPVAAAYNDPEFSKQWHYYNDGSNSGSLAGADINLLPAWEIESGKPEVIVAVVDAGIDYEHVDLAANMWVNEAEKNGVQGVDDDENGYLDDIYGYNFVSDNGKIQPDLHGTHVAGTIAAVNNNGIGVSGVAGGDGSQGSGVRLMSCQVLHTIDGGEIPGNFADAIVYGADNGAVISQNSWNLGTIELPEAEKAAIDYFTEYAGTDANGVQTGPMKGGIVIFAAGNNSNNRRYMPCAYEKCFAVSAMASNFALASFSTYGMWVEITAPGGELTSSTESEVYSTLPDDKYGWMYGTSMACPHVSGIAALAVSKYGAGSAGFTRQQLWNLLQASTNDVYEYNTSYIGQLGTGYIDAFKVLSGDIGGAAPQPVSDLEVEWADEYADISWSVTADPDSGKADRYDILCSESEHDEVSFNNPPAGANKLVVRVGDKAVGEKLQARLSGLEPSVTYYISMVAVDIKGNRSAIYTVSGSSGVNHPPVAIGIPDNVTLKSAEYREVAVEVSDPEGYEWDYSLVPGSGALGAEKTDDGVLLIFNAIKALPGSYNAKLSFADEQGFSGDYAIKYTIEPNNAPEVNGATTELVVSGTGVTKQFDLAELFADKDGDALSYELKLEDVSFATISASADGILTVRANKLGTSRLTVTATDPRGLSVDALVTLVCRDADRQIDLYPVPVRKDGILNIRMGEGVDGTIDVALFNTHNGAGVFNQTVPISPSGPSAINISSLPSGTYNVVVKHGTKEVAKIITKL